ncbi:hypothetical protein LTR70_004458 [Exophiala xenobiotica]|uniref:Fe2OG dioxygenase domain-containing protein n=1 Tax=Lithohypha guttulata TaxID=1690604 RepID=A0ABR0KDI4_9EURO|nr:hypothetical protein LTR24_003936 [Lithohypha guttulata]KAK5320880.1 hypothetical protein LTR70_004458 [Exophiala xenobiotica]
MTSFIMTPISSFNTIPMLDFHDLTTEKQRFLTQLREAIADVGFRLRQEYQFSGSPPQIELENSPHFVGYSAVGSETTAGAADQREQFEFVSSQDVLWKPGLPLYLRLTGPNQYPSSLPQATEVIEAYMQSMTDFASQFMKLVAEALGLPSATFLSFLSHRNRLKIVHYPAAKGEGISQGVGPHKDSSGWWTFLLQASSPEVKGLQVLNKNGEWIDVPNVPGSFVVNIGQAFEVVTHGACKATTHRVLGGPSERFSVPFFLGVRGDLTKQEALGSLAQHFPERSAESVEGATIDSAFLRGKYTTWGESELRTKVRSHRKAGRQFYSEVYERYVQDS